MEKGKSKSDTAGESLLSGLVSGFSGLFYGAKKENKKEKVDGVILNTGGGAGSSELSAEDKQRMNEVN